MLGERNVWLAVAEELLDLYSLEELLEINDVEETEAVEYLLRIGRLVYPESVIRQVEKEGP